MYVKDIMTDRIAGVTAEETIEKAARLMRDHDIGAVPVAESGVLKGMITDRDIIVRALAEGMDPGMTKVKDVMSNGVVTCRPEQTVEEAADLMKEKKVRRLIAVDDDHKAVGVLSIGDLAIKCPGTHPAGEAVEGVSKPTG